MIARNTVYGLGSQIVLRVMGFLFNIYVINRLGDAGYGQYSTVLAWTSIFAFIGDMGIAQYMAREIARDHDKSNELFWDVAALRFVLAIITSAVTVIGAVWSGYSVELVTAVALICSTYLIQAILSPLGAIIIGHERMDVASILMVLGQFLYFVAAGALLIYSSNYIGLITASLITLPITLIVSAVFVIRNNMKPPPIRLKPRNWPALLRFGLPFALIQVSLTFAFRFDTIILEKYYSDDVVGWYNAAYTLTRSLLIFSAAFSSSLVPTMAREYVNDPHSVAPWYFRSVKYIIMIGLPLAVGGTVLADKIILLLYGKDFAPAILAFAVLIWDTPFLMYTSICGNFTTAMKLEHLASRVYVGMGIFNIILNVLLIPRYGLLAAAVVTVATELAGAILFYRIFRRELGPGLDLKSMVRLGLGLLVMGTAAYLLRPVHILVSVVAGAGVYLLMIWMLGVLTAEERVVLTKTLARVRARLQKRT